jgi:hypothetical protein
MQSAYCSVNFLEGDLKMSRRIGGLLFIVAAASFWVSWLLMPGVGVTDPAMIFHLVSSQRSSVLSSVVVQLLSAALYVPALLGISTAGNRESDPGVRWGTGLLLLGAMGSAIDAVFHLLAYAMTEPGLESGSLLQVMAFMQGPGLRLVAPFIASFFVGSVFLSVVLARKRAISKVSLYIYAMLLVVLVCGVGAISIGIVSARTVGLSVLAVVSIAQACLGLELYRPINMQVLEQYAD